MTPRCCAVALLLSLAAIGCRKVERQASSPPSSPALEQVDPALLLDLALLATGSSASIGPATAAAGAGRPGERPTLERYIERLTRDERFARVVAPKILMGRHWQVGTPEYGLGPLKRSKPDAQGNVVHYQRRPCQAKVAERVRPWWDDKAELLVCPEAHQPTHRRDPKSGWYCGAANLSTDQSPFCGCGPNLIHCAPDEEHLEEHIAKVNASFQQELTKTVAHLTESDRPVSEVFTTRASWRDRTTEAVYQGFRITSGELDQLPDLSAWPAEGQWAPRHESVPGQHSGVLTMPQVFFQSDTARDRQRELSDLLWCIPPDSSGVTTEAIFQLGAVNLRDGEGWQTLAKMPICTGCHARLDYGMQFFSGFPDSFKHLAIISSKFRSGQGPLYMSDANDKRGEAPLNPQGFAQLAVAQPEFLSCLLSKLNAHVFGGELPGRGETVLRAAYARSPTLRNLMAAALTVYAEERMAAPGRGPAALAAGPTAGLEDAELRLPPGLARRVEEQCGACHGDGDPLNLLAPSLPRPRVRAMLFQLAFERMPKDTFLARQDRRALVGELINLLETDSVRRQRAWDYFGSALRGPAVHNGAATVDLLYRGAPTTEDEARWPLGPDAAAFGTLETPFTTALALTALEACEKQGEKGDALARCVTERTDPALFVR